MCKIQVRTSTKIKKYQQILLPTVSFKTESIHLININITYRLGETNISIGITQKQVILLKHQFSQHVQLLTQNYMLFTLTDKYQKITQNIKIMLVCN